MVVQLELFGQPADSGLRLNYMGVPGLTYFPNFLTGQEQQRVLQEVDSHPWQDDLKRRVQHYGYKYSYKARAIDHSMFVGPLPTFAVEVSHKLLNTGLLEEMPDQLIVNEYQPGQGITAHVDCEPCFKNAIVTISLGSVYEMDFISITTGEVRHASRAG